MEAIYTDRIALRALEPEDLDMVYMWENDMETWHVSSNKTPLSKFALASYIKTADKDIWESRELRLMITTIDGVPLGTIELFDFDPYHLHAGIGIMIYDPENRQKGFAFDALKRIESYAKHEVGIHHLYANITHDNNASISLFEKLEYDLVGVKKQWKRRVDHWVDECLYQKIL